MWTSCSASRALTFTGRISTLIRWTIWRANDAPDRQGITEIRHVTGYLAYWDELRRRHPDMLIDTCASGGRRNDLETLRRAVPLWRSDYGYDDPPAMQNLTYGLALWVPYFGTGIRSSNVYSFPQHHGSGLGCGSGPAQQEPRFPRAQSPGFPVAASRSLLLR